MEPVRNTFTCGVHNKSSDTLYQFMLLIVKRCYHAYEFMTSSIIQAKENLGATGWMLSSSEVEALDSAAAKVPKQLIQNSFQSD